MTVRSYITYTVADDKTRSDTYTTAKINKKHDKVAARTPSIAQGFFRQSGITLFSAHIFRVRGYLLNEQRTKAKRR
ncbi:MAG: hypothetical protein Q7U37_04815 [Gallionella sp.]|nr:hypothetical protein [Gallionella sp.]MDP1941580.1 hypothetical protein [Gallionella sp.]